MRILVVEDDAEVAAYILRGLRDAGHIAVTTGNGAEGLALASAASHDALIVDRMLPGLDGLALIGALRASGDDTPCLILSALGDVDDKVKGLRAGGDDYLAKPFAFPELLARLEVMTRRTAATVASTVLAVGDLEMNLLTRQVSRGGTDIALYAREFRLLEFLLRHRGQVVTRAMLLEGVWEYHFDPQTNVIDVHVSRLRAKIDKGFSTALIETVRGEGYRLG